MQSFACSGITKSYGAVRALAGVSLEIHPREITLLLGANGSGKTTLLRVLCGLARPDSGVVSVNGRAVTEPPARDLGYAGHEPGMYARLSVVENLALSAELLGQPVSIPKEMAHWGIEPYAGRRLSDLSRGQRGKVALCRALFHEPRIVLLDEPSAALDDDGVKVLGERLNALRGNGSSSLIATHDVSRLKALATRVVVLDLGKIILDSSVSTPVHRLGPIESAIHFYQERNR